MTPASVTVPALEAYRRLAPSYDSSVNPLLPLESRLLVPMLPELRGRSVIDVGAGTGRWTHYCISRGARTIALDFCIEMLRHAPRPAVVADARRLPLPDECADVVLCTFALGYAPSCLPELARIARVGGTVIVSDVHPDAIQQGWKRSFKVGAESIDIAHEPYQLGDLRHDALKLTNCIEPSLGEQERYLFEKAGRGTAFEACTRFPAIFIAAWVKDNAGS